MKLIMAQMNIMLYKMQKNIMMTPTPTQPTNNKIDGVPSSHLAINVIPQTSREQIEHEGRNKVNHIV